MNCKDINATINLENQVKQLEEELYVAKNTINYYLKELDGDTYDKAYERFKQAMRKAKEDLRKKKGER